MGVSRAVSTRMFVACVAAGLYAAGVEMASHVRSVHDNKNNWRAHLDMVAGNSHYVDSFEQHCLAKYNVFQRPSPSSHGSPDSPCLPPAADASKRNPISALTSLALLAAAFVAATYGDNSIVAVTALAAGGSFRHHGSGDVTGRVIDHAMAGAVAVCATHVVYSRMHSKSASIYLAAVAAATAALVSAGDIERNTEVAAILALVAGVAACLHNPRLMPNVLLPLSTGAVLVAYVSPPHERKAECTGLLADLSKYDQTHALWHICVAVGLSELSLNARTIASAPFLLAAAALAVHADASIANYVYIICFLIEVVLQFARHFMHDDKPYSMLEKDNDFEFAN